MEIVDRQSSPMYEEKTFDETTVFFTENGTVSKRRRKSLGRRVSFAEAPKLHIFPRDDEYVTPTRSTNGASSPRREGGERRSPRLAAKVVDADKENRVLASNSAPQRRRRRGGSKPLAAREGESPVLKPHNWLDARDPSSRGGDDEQNTGPVDLRHLSFNQKETEADEENLTLDSTTFALKSLQQIRIVELAAAYRSAEVSTDEHGALNKEDVLTDVVEKDMTLIVMNGRLLPRKPVRESSTGFESMSTDTNMSITMQAPRGQKAQMLVAGDYSHVDMEEEDDSTTVKSPLQDKKIPRAGNLRAPLDEKGGGDARKLPLEGIKISRAEDIRAQLEERFGAALVDLDEDTNLTTGSEENVDPIRVALVDLGEGTNLTTGSEEHVDPVRVALVDPDEDTNLTRGSEENVDPVRVALVDPDEDTNLTRGSEENVGPVRAALVDLDEDTNLTRGSEEDVDPAGVALVDLDEDTNLTRGSEKDVDPVGVALVDLDEDTNLTRGSEENLDPVEIADMTVCSLSSVASMGIEGRTITLGIPSLRQLIREEEVEDLSSIGQEDRTITRGIPSLRHLIREEEDATPVRPTSRSMWMTPPSSVITARAIAESRQSKEDDIYDTTAVVSEPSRDDGEDSVNATKVSVEEEGVPHLTIKSDDTTALIIESIREDGKESINAMEVLVEEEGVLHLSIKNDDTTTLTERIREDGDEITSATKMFVKEEGDPYLTIRSDDTAALIERRRENGEESINATEMLVEEGGVPDFSIKSGDVTALLTERIPEDPEERINVTKMSVDDFFHHAEVQFSPGLQSPRELLKDPSLAETHHVRSLSESFNFLCLVKPQIEVMRDACEELYEEVDIKDMAVAKLEQRLTASNPAIFSYFQKAPEGEKHRIRKQLERIQGSYRSLAENSQLHFQQRVEKEYSSNLLKLKTDMTYYVEHVHDQRNIFDEKCRRPFVRLLSSKSSRDANQECIFTSQSKLSTVKQFRTTANLERIEDLKKRIEGLKSAREVKLAKFRQRNQVVEATLRGLEQRVGRGKNKLSDLRSQLVDNTCSGAGNLQKEDAFRSPYLYVQKLKSDVSLLHKLQDGFQVKSAGRENQDMVVELSYRSLLKRRYVARKVGTAVKVLTSTWSLDPEKIEEVFPKMNALVVFSLALTTSGTSNATGVNSISGTQMFVRLSASEAVRFTLPTNKASGIPEPANLRESMQFSRILVGNLMELMDEVGRCQAVVNACSGGGIFVETRFRNQPDGHLQLELKVIDCISSIKFFLYLDMACLPMNGYPLGDLQVKVEIAYCAPPARHRFKPETLEQLLSLVKPGYHRLTRTSASVGNFLASLRCGVST